MEDKNKAGVQNFFRANDKIEKEKENDN